MDGWLPPPTAFLRSGDGDGRSVRPLSRRGAAVGHVGRRAGLRSACGQSAVAQAGRPGRITVPISWLRELTRRGADRLYPHLREVAQARLDKELAVIEAKDFPGYFLIVHDMVAFAKGRGILCQGRGSAANSVVCYTLGVTAVDPIKFDLPFERFLASTRDEEPDIDVDFDSERREEVIQEVYRRFGRRNAAQVANVVAYRPKSAIRDMAKALGYSTGQQDAWSKQIDSWSSIGSGEDHDIPAEVVQLADKLLKSPRHLGIHSGGMVLTEQPVGEVCPIERGRMDDRTVLQWDKDSCAWMGLVKFDFLGLGILNAIQQTFDLVDEWLGERWRLETIPKEEPAVYDMLCRADSVGSVPGREPGPDRHPAAAAAAPLLRPGGRGGVDPTGSDPGWGGAPLRPAQHRQGGGDLSPPAARAGTEADQGDPAVPGAADADRDDGRQLQRGRRRSAPPGDGIQAWGGKDRTSPGRPVRRNGKPRHHR